MLRDASAGSAGDAVVLELARAVLAVSLQAADRVGVSLVQLRTLTVLAADQPLNLRGLADRIGVVVSTASRLVDRLVAAGLVHRQAADHTRRELAVTLTGSGRQVLARYDSYRLPRLRAALEIIDQADRARLLADLSVFTAGLAAQAGDSAPAAGQSAGS